jgi:hypothetical protein
MRLSDPREEVGREGVAVSLRARPAAARMKVFTRERVNRGDTAATDRGAPATRPRPTAAHQ